MADKAIIDPKIIDMQATNIDSILQEQRKFEPPAEFSKHAHIKSLAEYERIYSESIDDPEKFWASIARELHWFKKWDKVLEWNCPWAKWFVGGQINLSYNCLDRHVADLAQEQSRASSGRASPAKSARSPISNCIAKCRSSPMF